ncbi:uncharacterized protein LOC131155634 [Malania oleifera]|uniref:uncharacterized protein LOC131155634 n=1 Tax=Malania oleifera TaxID=397392 RepID=UPI0025AE350C|nr:uncharacterized protein LOC131155634 [Malania oleifera]
MEPKGTVVFTTVGRPTYGFDIFSVTLSSLSERRLTDGASVNFNGHFADDDATLVYVSERTGSPRIYLNRSGIVEPELNFSVPGSLFHDRPVVKNGRVYFISAHEPAERPFKSWSAVYSTSVDKGRGGEISRLSPDGVVDYSPAVSRSGKFIAVASNGSGPWAGEFHELKTDIVVFRESDPGKRTVVSEQGGWPTWAGDSTLYFHRQADDGWWSIFGIDLPENFEFSGVSELPRRVTPPGLHAFTPAAFHDGKRIAVATRRRGKSFRHIEIFDLESQTFTPLTESLNPNFHHYNPFVSPECGLLGYHRFRGESSSGELIIPHLEPIISPIKDLRMLRLNGSFPSFSPDGNFIAFNPDFDRNSGLKIIKSDGSKAWSLLKGRTAFYNSWSPTEKNVIYTSIGPIFGSAKVTVQIARITFDFSGLVNDREDLPAEVKILTREDAGNNAFPACSQDGKSVLFRSGRSGHKNLYIIDAVNGEFDGGSIRQLTDGPWIDTMPCWSPDGDLIAFSSNRHNPDNPEVFSVYVVRPDGTGLRRIPVSGHEGSGDADRERVNHVCFSPDGEWLLFTANISGVTSEPVSLPNQFQPYGDLHVTRVDGSGLRRLTCNGYENGTPTWQADGDVGLERSSAASGVGDELTGDFEEPLWITCDI